MCVSSFLQTNYRPVEMSAKTICSTTLFIVMGDYSNFK